MMRHRSMEKPENFKLFMCCLGNGTTVSNSAVTDPETNDYKTIAHINNAGVISWYVNPKRIPDDAKTKIQACADRERAKWLGMWDSMPVIRKYERLLDWMSTGELIAFNYWLRDVLEPRNLDIIVHAIVNDGMCKRAKNTYGL